ncbi:MAG: hypothetical protein R3C14_17905 [Caldilineaceae bacterium]
MFKQQVNFEWQVGDDEFGGLFHSAHLTPQFAQTATAEAMLTLPGVPSAWTAPYPEGDGQCLPALTTEPGQWITPGELHFLLRRLRELFFLAIATLLVQSMAPTLEQLEQQRVEAGVAAALALEFQAWQQKDRQLFASLLDMPAAERWQWEWRDYWSLSAANFTDLATTVQHVARQGKLVQVETLVSRPSTRWWQSSPYREIRFYRESAGRWVRTLPPQSYWGAQHVAETEHLRFEYYAYDAPAIEPQMAKLETVYVDLHQRLELDPDYQYKWTFALIPDRSSGRMGPFYRYEYTSPALSEVPNELSDQDFVAQMMVSTMASRAVYGGAILSRRSYLNRWEMLVWALYGWLRTDLLQQRSPWHAQAQAIFRESIEHQLPLTLDDLERWPESNRPAQERVMRQYMVSESLIDFAMTTYGRDKLPRLLQGLERYREWDQLTAEVFGVSTVTFATGWNGYLEKTYLQSSMDKQSNPTTQGDHQ